ncbi:acetoacetyl-CoA synthase [Rhizobium sp. BK068]|nr:acetoacetyl-CoA synthase [Rhizobium sp. BK068]
MSQTNLLRRAVRRSSCDNARSGSDALPRAGPILRTLARFFPDAQLNYAENLLVKQGAADALLFRGEDKVNYRWSWDKLHSTVSKLQQAFRAMGIGKGDRVSAMMPNMPETIACMLASASIGAIWSSCSPDFGEQGVLDRFGQIEPKLFITCDAYWYNGKLQDVGDKVRAVAPKLGCPVVVVKYAGDTEALAASLPNAQTFDAVTIPFTARPVEYEPLPFSHPLYILVSSGTTGVPKCIVHSAGGTLLQHLKEHRFHSGVGEGDKLFYFTTCGWMMWNWLASGLASGATLCLFDGSPFAPSGNVLWDYAAQQRFAIFGTSAKYIDAVRKGGIEPLKTHDLSELRLITSTGSPLSPEGFSFVYEGIKPDVQLASISGGTDIVSCFVLGNPVKPVWRGEIQGPGLGLAVDVWDDEGKPVRGEKGELVCTKASPPCRWASGTTRTARNIAQPISSASTMSGATAISPNGQNMAASSSMAARMRRSIPAACGSVRPRSTTRSNSSRKWPRRSASAKIGMTTCESSSSSASRLACSWTRNSTRSSPPKSVWVRRRVTCRPKSFRSPTFRAPGRERSSNSPSARSSTADR